MAFSVVQHTAFAHQTSGAFSVNLTAGNTAVVGLEINLGSTVSSVVGSNNGTYTLAGTYTDSVNTGTIYSTYYFPNVISGAETITVNGITAANLPDLMLVEVNGLGASPSVNVTGGNSGNSSAASLTLNPTAAAFIFVSAVGNAPGTLTNLTLLDTVNDIDYYNTTSGSGSVTMSDSLLGTSVAWAMFGTGLVPSSSINPTISGTVSVTGSPVVTLVYVTNIAGTPLVTGAVSPSFNGQVLVSITGSVLLTGSITPTLFSIPALSGNVLITGVVNVSTHSGSTVSGSSNISPVAQYWGYQGRW